MAKVRCAPKVFGTRFFKVEVGMRKKFTFSIILPISPHFEGALTPGPPGYALDDIVSKFMFEMRIVQKLQASKELTTLALDSRRGFPIPGEQAFPFPSLFKPPANAQDEEIMRNYLQQLRQEMGVRLLERIFPNPDGMPSKWWLCFAKRRFMDKQLTHTL
uniref:Actin-related protein 2/3 complex subunit 3 n=2 Tax=Meloidogyne incognita group TaxID=654580 RepID=A0A914KY09_MELIC